MKPWQELDTDERRAILTPLWADGLSAGEIASQIPGATRSGIIGQVHRFNLPKRTTVMRTNNAKPKPTPKPKAKREPKPKPQPKFARKPIPAQPGTPPIIQRIPETEASETVMAWVNGNRPPIDGVQPIDMMQLPNRPGVRCRFPVEGGYCGATSGDRMYCKTHHAVMYRPAEKIRVPREARRL